MENMNMKNTKKKTSRGEKGFTLIELLVVVAILGVLAAVVVPNVSKFMGSGKNEAGATELHNVQLAVTAMMADQGISSITDAVVYVATAGTATQTMTAFPSSTDADQKLSGGTTYGNYLQKSPTAYYYTCEADGTVRGWWTATTTHLATTGEIGVEDAP